MDFLLAIRSGRSGKVWFPSENTGIEENTNVRFGRKGLVDRSSDGRGILSDQDALLGTEMVTTDLHNYKRQLERQIELIHLSQEMSPENKQSALAFKDYLLSEGIGVAKIGRYLLDVRKKNRLVLMKRTMPQR